MCAYIEVKLGYKISIVVSIESTKTSLDHVAMLFYTSSCVASGVDIEYIRFNMPELYSKAGSTNSDICYLALVTNISNFLYGV